MITDYLSCCCFCGRCSSSVKLVTRELFTSVLSILPESTRIHYFYEEFGLKLQGLHPWRDLEIDLSSYIDCFASRLAAQRCHY